MDTGSDSERVLNIFSDSGTGNLVLIVLNAVLTLGTLTGSKLYFAIFYPL